MTVPVPSRRIRLPFAMALAVAVLTGCPSDPPKTTTGGGDPPAARPADPAPKVEVPNNGAEQVAATSPPPAEGAAEPKAAPVSSPKGAGSTPDHKGNAEVSGGPAPPLPPGYAIVAPGTFQMGSPPETAGADPDELHFAVKLTHQFLMSRTETTAGEFKALLGTEPSKPGCEENCPVTGVNWFEAIYFANKLSAATDLEWCYEMVDCTGTPGSGCDWSQGGQCKGDFSCGSVKFKGTACKGWRLPTEAEWEYVARGGAEQKAAAPSAETAWFHGKSKGKPHPVGSKPAAKLGIHDLYGNVAEWTWDGYGKYPPPPATDPTGDDAATRRVFRGGSFAHKLADLRPANRSAADPARRDHKTGFRLVRTWPYSVAKKDPAYSEKALLSPLPFLEAWKKNLLRCGKDIVQEEITDEAEFAYAWVWEGTGAVDEPGYKACADNTKGVLASREGVATFSATCLDGHEVADFDADGRADIVLSHTDCAAGPMESLTLEVFVDRPGGPSPVSIKGIKGDITGFEVEPDKTGAKLIVETVPEISPTGDGPEPTKTTLQWVGTALQPVN